MLDWPTQPVEKIPADQFRPPFCPWPNCPSNRAGVEVSFRKHGVFVRSDHRSIPRFRCRVCLRTCSQQTFSCTYYLKRPELIVPIAAGLNAGSAHRQLGRSLECSPSTVTNLSARLGRHALLLLAHSLDNIDSIDESLAYDDFECFVYSQDHPVGIGTPVGRDSGFVYGLESAPHRRGGKRSPRHKTPGKSHRRPGAHRRAFERTLDLLGPKRGSQGVLDVYTDGHRDYRDGHATHPLRAVVRHHVFPNPVRGPKGSQRSKEAVQRDAAMFAVDLFHKLARHTDAHHRRETIAFNRRHNALMERAFLLAIWRNFVKARTERRPSRETPAVRIGLASAPWRWSQVLAQRLFPWRIPVPPSWELVYRRDLTTEAVGRNRRHRLRNAF